MPTSPEVVRSDLTAVTSAVISDLNRAIGGSTASEIRASLFAIAPLVVADYIDGSAALALDWYDEIRAESGAPSAFTPSPLTLVTDDDVAAAVAGATTPLYDLERNLSDEPLDLATSRSLRLVEAQVQRSIASGFWDTMTGNSVADPDARGWARFARAGACKLCTMIAGRGAVFTRATADFAAHTSCHCVARPVYDPSAPEATAIQYVASKRRRTDQERAELRDYLNKNYPDLPG